MARGCATVLRHQLQVACPRHHFHVPAFIRALMTEDGVLSVTALELFTGFALMEFIMELEPFADLFPEFPFIKAKDSLFTSRAWSKGWSSEIFDSLEVKTDLYLIKFKPKKTLHYNSNLFDDNSNWILKKVELTAPTQFKRNPISSDNYYFIIKQENITK